MKSHGVTRLRLLGAPAIDGPGVDGQAVLKQPKRLLLLAYLAAHGDFVTRDTLLGLFWPTLDEDRARRALSQALHFLRTTLGPRSIVKRGATEVAIGPTVRCDLVEFESALEQGLLDVALGLYEGDLLSGVIPPRARELGGWLESERSRLLGLAVDAARKLSDAAYQEHDLATAIGWLRRAMEISPFDESAHREYISLLHEAGDGAGALTAHEAFRARLSEQFDLEPSEATVRVVNLIRGRPSASNGDESTPAEPRSASESRSEKRTDGRRDRGGKLRSGSRRWLGQRQNLIRVGAISVALVVTVIVGSMLRSTSGMELPLMPNRVAVLYFDVNGQEDELRHLADGITEALIGYLSQATSLDVIPANGVRRFRLSTPPPDTITRSLRAGIIVRGSVTGSPGKARVSVAVVEGETGSQRPSIVVESEGKDLLETIDEVSHHIAQDLSPEIGDVVTLGQWRAGTEDPQALVHMFRAGESIKNAEDQVESGSESRVRMAYDAADAKLLQAATLDPDWAEPIVIRGRNALGRAWFCLYQQLCQGEILPWLDRAAALADSALEVDSLTAGALEVKGVARLRTWMLEPEPDTALLTEAEKLLNHAVTLDWKRAGAWAALSSVHFARGDFAMAESAAENALEQDAFLEERAEIQMRLFQSAFHRERDMDAKRWCDAVVAYQREGNWLGAECTINLLAWSPRYPPDVEEAWRALDRGLLHEGAANAALVRPRLELLIAAVMARAGDPDGARDLIERALDSAVQHDADMLYYAAGAYVALGDLETAKAYLERFMTEAPANRRHVVEYRWFRDLDGAFSLPAARAPGGF